MDRAYAARPLQALQIDQAFPIVRAIAPDLDIKRWRAFAAAVLAPEPAGAWPGARGIMTVQSGGGYIHGLFTHRVEDDLGLGPVLEVSNFVVLDMFDQSGAAGELLRGMDELAYRMGCRAVYTTLPDDSTGLPDYRHWALECFRGAGHTVETLRLHKHLAGLPLAVPPLLAH